MRIVTLIENTKGNKDCCYEHGLSLYIETQQNKILFDTGASGIFTKNAELSDIDLQQVNRCVLSHGHYDHTGGVLAFHEINKDAKIYMSQYADREFYHKDEKEERYIGVDKKILTLPQMEYTNGNMELDEEMYLFTGVKGTKLWPKGNRALVEKRGDSFIPDEFLHEQYLVLTEKNKKVLISGCAHKGIVNIMEEYRTLFHGDPDVVISGFHLRNKEGYTKEEVENIEQIANVLLTYNTKFYTGHCTGEEPYEIMKKIMGDQLEYLHSTDEVFL